MDKALQLKQTRERVRRYRALRGSVTETADNVTQSPESVTKTIDNVTQYHPIMKWLLPGEKRDKLEKIVQSLKRHNVLRNSYLGCGVHSLPLDVVAEMLEVTCR